MEGIGFRISLELDPWTTSIILIPSKPRDLEVLVFNTGEETLSKAQLCPGFSR